jgi:histidinol dehydrogenase
VISVSRTGAEKLGKLAAVLADGEGLAAHKRAAEMRFK